MRSYFFQRIVLGPGIVRIFLSGLFAVEHNLKHTISFPSLNGFALRLCRRHLAKRGGEPGLSASRTHAKELGATWAPELTARKI